MALTVDYTNRIIESDASILDSVAFHQSLRDIEVSVTGILYPAIHTYKEIALGGGTVFPAVAFINGWTLQFIAGNFTVTGGNYDVVINPVANCYVMVIQSAAYAVSPGLVAAAAGSITFSGSLQADTASVYGTDYIHIPPVLTGVLEASPSLLAGAGYQAITATGYCVSELATVTAEGSVTPLVVVNGYGLLEASRASTDATASHGWSFAAAVHAEPSNLFGAGYMVVFGSGNLLTTLSHITGTGFATRECSATLAAQPSNVLFAGTRGITGTASVEAGASTVQVQWHSVGTGDLRSLGSTLSGGLYVEPLHRGFEVFSSLDELNQFVISHSAARIIYTGAGDIQSATASTYGTANVYGTETVRGTGHLIADIATVSATVTVIPEVVVMLSAELQSSTAYIAGIGETYPEDVRCIGRLQASSAVLFATTELSTHLHTFNAALHSYNATLQGIALSFDFTEGLDELIVVEPTEDMIVVLPIDDIIHTLTIN
jgi:hypothetical protein